MTALALVLALTSMGAPLVDGVRAVPANDYVCPDLPGDGAGDNGYGPRWNAELPESVTTVDPVGAGRVQRHLRPLGGRRRLAHHRLRIAWATPTPTTGHRGQRVVPDAPRLVRPARRAGVLGGVARSTRTPTPRWPPGCGARQGGWSRAWALPTVNGADPWLIVLMAVLTFLLVITIGIIISIVRHEDHD